MSAASNSVLLHGLGQNASSWRSVEKLLNSPAFCPNLFDRCKEGLSYEKVFAAFEDSAAGCPEPLKLCGLSLGGILALDYAGRFPERVRSIVLIGVPHRIPALLFAFQNAVFRLMPQKAFESMGVKKADIISLCRSMRRLDIKAMAEKVGCPALILCGSKDKANAASVDTLCGWISKSEARLIENCGHEVNIQQPEALAKELTEFWS